MAEDRALLKQLKELREKREKEKGEEKLAIVCFDLLLTPQKAVLFKVEAKHPKHNGNIWACNDHALTVDSPLFRPVQWITIREKAFKKNIISYVER